MADQKLADLTADASPTSDDLVYVVNDPSGTPADRKVTLANLASAMAGMAGLTGAFQPLDGELTAIAGLTSAADKIIRFTGSGTAGLLDFKDEDNMSSDSATALPSQQSVKAYVDDNAPGALLAIVNYRAGSNTTYSTSSTTLHDLDDDIAGAAVLAVTFTAPASGAVYVRLTSQAGNDGNYYQAWNLRDSVGDVADTVARVIYGNSSFPRVSHVIYKSGLTPGASYTWKWGWRTVSAGTVNVYSGPDSGPMTMEVSASPL